MKEIGIYKIENKINGHCYIGSSKNIKKRWYEHKRRLRNGKHHSIVLQRAWIKYGEDNFNFELLCNCLENKLLVKEQEYFDKLNPEYVILKVAGRFTGYQHTEETKKIIREKRSKQVIIMTKERRNNISKSKKDIPLSDNHKKALSKSHKGKKLSIEHINNLKKYCTSQVMSEKQKKSVEVRKKNATYTVDTATRKKIGEANSVCIVGVDDQNKILHEFSSYSEAARYLNKSEITLWRYIKNSKKYNNLIWKRKTDYVP